jgi:hypothetical protein
MRPQVQSLELEGRKNKEEKEELKETIKTKERCLIK